MTFDAFLQNNHKYLSDRLVEATDYTVLLYGFGSSSPKHAFGELLNKKQEHMLPFCLYLINFGIGVTKDEMFAQNSLELISFDDGVIINSTAAYIYAYCISRNLKEGMQQSEVILRQLFSMNFEPAIITSADLDILNNSINRGLGKYKLAMDMGHKGIWGRYYKLLRKHSSFPTKQIALFKWMIKIFPGTLSAFVFQSKGNSYLYLDFYDIKSKI